MQARMHEPSRRVREGFLEEVISWRSRVLECGGVSQGKGGWGLKDGTRRASEARNVLDSQESTWELMLWKLKG